MKFALWMAVAIALASPAHAQMDRGAEGLYRIDIAGSLRMRTQRMVRNACYVAAGVQTDSLTAGLTQEIGEVDAIQLQLIDGDEAIGLRAERSPIIRHQIEDVISVGWEQFKLYPLYISARGSAEASELDQMTALGDRLLVGFNALVGDLEEKYARGAVLPADQTRTLNVMGRQRMLSQRIAAQHCTLAFTADRPAAETALRESLATLDQAFGDLLNGNPDARIVSPSAETTTALTCAHDTFRTLRPMVETALLGATPTAAEMEQAFALSNQLMAQSHQALQIANDGFNDRPLSANGSCQTS